MMIHDADADLALIRGRRVAVVGYGSQGHAHAQNLRDSGVEVKVALRPGSRSRAAAERDGFAPVDPAAATDWADVIMILAPDLEQPALFRDEIAPHLRPGQTAAVRARLRHPLRLDHAATRAWTWPWSPRRRPAIASARCSSKAPACRR